MADLSDTANWFEVDGSNNRPPPNGWPEGMMPSGVNDTARADKGALKRFWDKLNPVQTVTPSGGVYTFNTSNIAYPTAYVNGEVYRFKAGNYSVGGDQFQVNALGPKPIWKRITIGSGWAAIIAQDITTSIAPELIYDSTLNGGSGAFILLNPFVPIYADGGGGVTFSGGLSVAGNISASGLSVSGTSSFGSDVAMHGAGTALTLDSGGLVVSGTGYFGGDVTIHGGGTGLTVDNGSLAIAGTGYFGGDVTIHGGGLTALSVDNGSIACSGDIAAGIFRHYGGPGAVLECWAGDWGTMSFAVSGSQLLVSADRGSSGFRFANVGTFSDARLKTDIRDTAVDALAMICATPVREFGWNERGREVMPHVDPLVPCGLVAQELEETIPFAVGTTPLADNLRHINDPYLTPYLFRAIQQLAERLATLEAE